MPLTILESEKYCPNCGNKIKIESKFCKNCGIQVPNKQNIPPTDKICSKCGFINDGVNLFCSECGNKLDINYKRKETLKTAAEKKNKINWTGIFLGSIVGMIMIFAFSSNSSFIVIYIVSLLIGGFIATFVGGGNNRISLKYGLIIGLIFMFLLYFDRVQIFPPVPGFGILVLILFFLIFVVELFLSSIIGTVGALFGIFVNSIIENNYDNLRRRWKKGEM